MVSINATTWRLKTKKVPSKELTNLKWFLSGVRSHVTFEIRVDFELGSADVTLKGCVSRMRPQMHHQLTRVSTGVRTDHAFEGPIVRMSPHVLFHGTALAARVIAKLAAKGFVAGMNALVNLEFVDAIEGLFTFATNERLFPGVDQQMPLQVFCVFRHVYTTFEDRVEGGGVGRKVEEMKNISGS